MLKLHDTHCHLDLLFQRLNNLPELIISEDDLQQIVMSSEYLPDANFISHYLSHHEFVIQPGVSTVNTAINYQLWQNESQVYFLLGAHPEIVDQEFDVQEFVMNQKLYLGSSIKSNPKFQKKLVGVGECGLDYFYTQDQNIINNQKLLFQTQIQLALDNDLPLVIHCRDAFEDLFIMLDQFPEIFGRFEIHCFTGNLEQMNAVIERGGYIGVGGILTFKSAGYLRECVTNCPRNRLLLETDAPFLAPVPYRGEVCLPEYISHTSNVVAQLWGVTTEEVWRIARENTLSLFEVI